MVASIWDSTSEPEIGLEYRSPKDVHEWAKKDKEAVRLGIWQSTCPCSREL